MSRFLDRVRDAGLDHSRPRDDWWSHERPFRVLTVASNKGGVGKTTIAANLAVYVRALREDLPILILGFDDQMLLDRMFALGPGPARRNMASALRSGTLAGAIQLGQYGVHYVPSCTDISSAKRTLDHPFDLQTILHRTDWRGLIIIDTKSDLEILTQNALAASDLTLAVVKDEASLYEAKKVYELLAKWEMPPEHARVVLSMVNLRIKYGDPTQPDILALLVSEIRRLGYPLLESFLSVSAKVEALYTNPTGNALPILSGAPKSLVHRQMYHLAHDVLKLLEGTGLPFAGGRAAEPPTVRPAAAAPIDDRQSMESAPDPVAPAASQTAATARLSRQLSSDLLGR